MTRILFIAFLLTGCGCAQQPIQPEAQSQMQALATSYALAHKVHKQFCAADQLPQPCVAAQTAEYNFSAAYTTANGTRTAATIAEAQRKLMAYQTAVEQVF